MAAAPDRHTRRVRRKHEAGLLAVLKVKHWGPSMKLKVTTGALLFYSLVSAGCVSPSLNRNSQRANPVSAPASPAPTSNPSGITGSSFQEDAAGDVRDGNHRKPGQKLPGIDLTRVRVESVESDLKVTFTSDSDFPAGLPADQSAIWQVTACTPDGSRCCMFGAKVIGDEWKTHVFTMNPAYNVYAGASQIRSGELIITIPQDKLPEWMGQPFKWWADSEWNGNWSDRVPDEGKEILSSPSVPFPKAVNK